MLCCVWRPVPGGGQQAPGPQAVFTMQLVLSSVQLTWLSAAHLTICLQVQAGELDVKVSLVFNQSSLATGIVYRWRHCFALHRWVHLSLQPETGTCCTHRCCTTAAVPHRCCCLLLY